MSAYANFVSDRGPRVAGREKEFAMTSPKLVNARSGHLMSRRNLVRDAAIGGVGLPLAAMLGPLSSSMAAGGQATDDITFWSRETFNNGSRQPLLEERVSTFDDEHGTNTTVQFMVFQESIQKTQAALAAGNPPDLAQQGPDVALQFAAGGSLRALDDVFSPMRDQLVPVQREAFVELDGATYGIPWYLETRVLFYHKDLLEEAGIEPPTTFAEWSEAAQALTKGDEQYGFVISTEGPGAGQLWIPLASSAGGDLLDENGNIQANTAPFEETLEFLGGMYHDGVMPEATPTYTANDVLQLFLLKRSAMYITNGNLLADITFQAPDLLPNIGAVLVPAADENAVSRSFLGGFHLFVFDEAPNADAATELLQFLFEDEWYSEYVQFTGGAALPVLQKVADLPFYQEDPLLSKLVEQLPTAIRYGGVAYGNAPYLGEAEGALLFSEPVIDVMTGNRTAAEAVENLQSSLEALKAQ